MPAIVVTLELAVIVISLSDVMLFKLVSESDVCDTTTTSPLETFASIPVELE